MKTFLQWVEGVGLKWPADCNGPTISRKAVNGGNCSCDAGGDHDKVRRKLDGSIVTVVPRHRRLNPNTCRSIIKRIEGNC